jgi:GntR family transcriptional regulator, transcriptional repressor for pyruvate dehydrogenase complex
MAPPVKKRESGSVVKRTAIALREDILNSADGAFLGSESDLVSRFKVSRPTFRQASKLLEQEQLLVIKRGVGGGFFARQPSAQAVAHVAAVYLLSRKATIEDAIRAARPLFADTARLAARRGHPNRSARLRAFVLQQEEFGANAGDLRAFLRSEREFLSIFASLSGNPVLQLYATVLVDFAGTFVAQNVYSNHPDRIAEYQAVRRSLIQAIIDGDEELAELLSLRRSDAIIGWMESDMGVGKRPSSAKKQLASRSKRANRQLIGLTRESLSPSVPDRRSPAQKMQQDEVL